MSGRNFASYAPMDQRVIDLERQQAYVMKLVESLARSREARFIGGGSGDGDRVEAFMLNEQLNAMGSASATILTDSGALSSETITLKDIIMSPGDFVASGSKGWMRLRNGEWKIVVPYCKPTGENPPPPQEVEPPAPTTYQALANRRRSTEISVADQYAIASGDYLVASDTPPDPPPDP